MTLSINSNAAADSATFNLGRNNFNLRKSISRLSSGKRIVQPMDDAGGLAVAMKLNSSVNRSASAMQNILNAISMLEVQDGVLSSAADIVDRMAELKSLYDDVMKSPEDKATYNTEFRDLQVQLYEKTLIKFNGVSLFARYTNEGSEGVFEGTQAQDNTLAVYLGPDGDASPKASLHKALLLSALTINASTLTAVSFGGGDQTTNFRLANESTDGTGKNAVISLGRLSVGVYAQALQNIATLRAQNGATMSQLKHGYDNLSTLKTNMMAGVGRIMDVDVASESTTLAKNNVLVQASASMLSQANALPELALVLLR